MKKKVLKILKHLPTKKQEDLIKIKELAQDRPKWKEIQQEMVKAAEASQSEDGDAKGS